MLSSVYVPIKAEPLPLPLRDKIYFSVDWCPREEALAELSKHLVLKMNGCCIGEAEVLSQTKSNPDVLAPWEYRTAVEGYPNARCDGKVLTAQEEDSIKLIYIEKKIARAEQGKIDEAIRLSEAPEKLKSMSKEAFCVAYGNALRGKLVEKLGYLPESEMLSLVKREAVRRKQKFNDALVRKGLIKIGNSECQLYASWGIPVDQNQSVGSWGVHTQHVYGSGNYVYTENGRVTSWQN